MSFLCLDVREWAVPWSCTARQTVMQRYPQDPLKGVVQGSLPLQGLASNKQSWIWHIQRNLPDGKVINVSYQNSSGVHFSGLEFMSCWFQLRSKVVSLILVWHIAGIIFSFNISFLTCHSLPFSSSQEAPLLEAIKQQPYFLFLYSVALKYLITEWINTDACSTCSALPGWKGHHQQGVADWIIFKHHQD